MTQNLLLVMFLLWEECKIMEIC